MPRRDIIVVGASAGGVEALVQLAGALPTDLPAAVFVVLHVMPRATSILPQILSRSGPLPARHATNGEPIEHGHIYVAPPDCHLLLHHDQVRVARGPKENGHRPAVDALFRTAARAFGGRVVGVILSGALDDGTAGLAAIKQRGGVAVVQDPHDANSPGMPQSALENVQVDYCLPLAEIGHTLVRLVQEPIEEAEDPVPQELAKEAAIAELDPALLENEPPGMPAGFACPDCGGTLWEIREGDLIRFRCRVGHAWSVESLQAEQSQALEQALWTAFRALQERQALTHRMASKARHRGLERAAASFEQQAEETVRHAALLRHVLLNLSTPSPEEPLAEDTDSLAPHRDGGH